jgi:hypothetical protein
MRLLAVRAHVRAVSQALGHAELAALADHGARVTGLVAEIPQEAWHKIEATVTAKYQQLEQRYGRPMAVAIVSAGILGTAVPLPGTSVLAAMPLIGLAELHHRLSESPETGPTVQSENTRLDDAVIRHHSTEWIAELTNLVHQVCPESLRRS